MVREVIYGQKHNDGKSVFVFGSNSEGRHGKGAALTARKYWGARTGWGAGRVGMSYAIPTKGNNLVTLNLSYIKSYVRVFIDHVKTKPHEVFLVTRVGCGLAGHSDKDMAEMFYELGAFDLENIRLPEEWIEVIKESKPENKPENKIETKPIRKAKKKIVRAINDN